MNACAYIQLVCTMNESNRNVLHVALLSILFLMHHKALAFGGINIHKIIRSCPHHGHHLGSKARNSNSAVSKIARSSIALQSSSSYSDSQMELEIKDLMTKHDPILLFASRLLPPTASKDASALYAWCRRLDEIADDEDEDNFQTIQQRLQDWEHRFEKLCNNQPMDAMDEALAQCLQRNAKSLTTQPFLDMMDGMKADAVPNRVISNMEELEEYAYQVAGTVGLMLLPLLDADMERARSPAIALGKAIQLINILRDAAPDAALGRVYLPQDILSSEGVLNGDILSLKSSKGYCRVVKRVAARADDLLQEAQAGKSSLPGLGPLFVQIIVELYRGYLVKLEQMEYNNMNMDGDRVSISTLQKITAASKAALTVLIEK